jgi:hypothetical protein
LIFFVLSVIVCHCVPFPPPKTHLSFSPLPHPNHQASRGGRHGREMRDAKLLVAHTAFVVFDEADLLWTSAQTVCD